MTRPLPGSPSAGIALWGVRLLLVAFLVFCSLYGRAHFARARSFSGCLEMQAALQQGTPPCLGEKLVADRWPRVVRRADHKWILAVEDREFSTATPLQGVEPGDRLEVVVTFLGPEELRIDSYAVLHKFRLQARVWLSIVASLVVVALLVRRRLTRASGRPGGHGQETGSNA